jgi:hypothetical protein
MGVIRFRDLVKMAGTPEPKSLWSDPKNDRDFMRAVKQKRVLTVVQESKRKDFGELGFHQHPGALYFIFPKPLPAEEGRVIGIKYDLAEPGEPADVVSSAELNRAAKKSAKSRKPEQPKPVVKTFQVAVRRVAMMETSLAIDAYSQAEARAKAVELMKRAAFDLSNAEIESEIKSVKSV